MAEKLTFDEKRELLFKLFKNDLPKSEHQSLKNDLKKLNAAEINQNMKVFKQDLKYIILD